MGHASTIRNPAPALKQFAAFGALNSINTFDPDAQEAVKASEQRVMKIERLLSASYRESDISLINRSAGISIREVHSDTYFILKKAAAFSEITDGMFDVTIKPVADLWRAARENSVMPIESELSRALGLVGHKNLLLVPGKFGAALKKRCAEVDVGALIRGYAAGEAEKVLSDEGIFNSLIEIGSDVVASGVRPDGRKWIVPISGPSGIGKPLGMIRISDMSAATSGALNDRFPVEGVKYHMVIDPKTGYPAVNDLVSVTVVSSNAVDADALSTAIAAVGLEKGMDLLRKFPGTEAIVATMDGKVVATPGIKNDFKILDKDFVMA